MTRSLSCLLALSAVGCAHAPPPVAAPARPNLSVYYPLAVGNQWTYLATFLGDKRVQNVEIVAEHGGYFEDTQHGELAVDGYGIKDHKRYLLRSPIEPGAAWTNVVSVASVEHYVILSVGEPCSAPAGRFDACVRVESKNRVDANTTLSAEFTFAPHVGLVKIKTVALTLGREIPQAELVLAAYHLVQGTPPTGER